MINIRLWYTLKYTLNSRSILLGHLVVVDQCKTFCIRMHCILLYWKLTKKLDSLLSFEKWDYFNKGTNYVSCSAMDWIQATNIIYSSFICHIKKEIVNQNLVWKRYIFDRKAKTCFRDGWFFFFNLHLVVYQKC